MPKEWGENSDFLDTSIQTLSMAHGSELKCRGCIIFSHTGDDGAMPLTCGQRRATVTMQLQMFTEQDNGSKTQMQNDNTQGAAECYKLLVTYFFLKVIQNRK